jgi:Flp pilus assembly protein TadG
MKTFMQQTARFIARPVARFAKDTNASIAVEAALIIPLLAAWFVGSFVFFDAFKSRNTALKTSYTISDVLSRRTDNVTPAYLDNLHQLYDTLAQSRGASALRVSVIKWDGAKHDVTWSHSSHDVTGVQTNAVTNLAAFANRIPLMSEGEQVILVETFQSYDPVFNVGINSNVLENFIVTSPRYAGQLGFSG